MTKRAIVAAKQLKKLEGRQRCFVLILAYLSSKNNSLLRSSEFDDSDDSDDSRNS
jgi:hypothetical protein